MKNIILSSLVAILIFSSCVPKECQLINGTYVFEIPVTLSPAKDTFNVGDTIFIVSEFLDEVFEYNTKKTYKFPAGLSISASTRIHNISMEESLANISDNFEVIMPDNSLYQLRSYADGTQLGIGEYEYFENKYKLKFGLIPLRPGLYAMEQTCSLYKLDLSFEDKCERYDLSSEAFNEMNDGAANNIHLLNDSPDPHFSEWILIKPQERFYKFGGYCFYVK